MIAMLWAYEGWNNITFTAGEIRNPRRNLPLSLVLGMSAVTLIYVGMNLVYVYAMPVGDMMKTPRIGETAAAVLFGGAGAELMRARGPDVGLRVHLGDGDLGPRVFYAMAQDGLFFRGLARSTRAGGRRRAPSSGRRSGRARSASQAPTRALHLRHLRRRAVLRARRRLGDRAATHPSRLAAPLQDLGLSVTI